MPGGLLQPLPLRWSGRPRGLRIVNIVSIVNTVNINNVSTP